MIGRPPLPPPRALGAALPRGLAWSLLPWRRLRRWGTTALALLAGAGAWLGLAEPGAEALPTATVALAVAAAGPAGRFSGDAIAPGPTGDAPLAPPAALVAGAEMLLPGVDVFGGEASYYAAKFEGRPTASGEPYRGERLTAAHRTLPFGTRVRVTNLVNGRSVVVRINDRGPFHRRRVIDLSRRAAERLGMVRRGRVPVEVRVLAAIRG